MHACACVCVCVYLEEISIQEIVTKFSLEQCKTVSLTTVVNLEPKGFMDRLFNT